MSSRKNFLCGTFTTHSFQGGKIWVFPFASETFVFLVELYSKTFARAFLYFIALSRVYFTLGGFGGPEKDQVLKVS